MALNTDFNFNPYYDDYDETKKHLRILFKPGFAVQARELTQMQTILQKQIERFGNHMFVNGSFVLGAKSVHSTPTYIKLQNEYDGELVDVKLFEGKTIYNVPADPDSPPTKRADVVVAIPRDDAKNEPPTLMIAQIYGDPFTLDETIRTDDVDTEIRSFARISNETASIGTGQAFSVEEGVFFYGGYFIYVEPQSIAVSKYDTTSASVRVGFQVNEGYASYRNDPSLLDPALESSNYQAPGADRYYIDLVLTTVPLTSEDNLDNFVEIAQYKGGKVQNTKRPSVYNKIGDEMAKRTFDESGNYVVNPFTVTVAANTVDTEAFDLTVSPGRAYVKGYEIDMVYPTTITLDKARATTNVSKANIAVHYGDFYRTTRHSNTFNINTLDPISLFCVPRASINTSNLAIMNNTRIGVARIKSVKYVGAANVSDSNTYQYHVSLMGTFDTNMRNLTANVVSTKLSKRQIVFPKTFSEVNDAYAGAGFRIIQGPGAEDGARGIIDYNGRTRTATLGRPLISEIDSNSVFMIEFGVGSVKCLANTSGLNILASADIDDINGVIYKGRKAFRFSRAINAFKRRPELIFNIGANWVEPGSIKNISYFYQRRFVGTLSSGAGSISLGGTNERFVITGPEEELIQNGYIFACRSPGTSPYRRGQIIPHDKIELTGEGSGTLGITITNGGNMQFELIATIRVFPTGGNRTPNRRTKTLITAELDKIPDEEFGVFAWQNRVKTFSSNGQIHIAANSVTKVPNRYMNLYLVDGKSLRKVLDFRGNNITTANMTTAIDVTRRYKFDRGARHSWYGWCKLRLKPNVPAPRGPLAVFLDRWKHDSNPGYFTVDSYQDINGNVLYEEIPYHTTFAGHFYSLRDSIDFRRGFRESVSNPVSGAVLLQNAYDEENLETTGPKFPKKGSRIFISYEHYLPRIDKLILSMDGKFEVLSGVPSLRSNPPADKENAITLYDIRIPAYTIDIKDIEFKQYDNRRYTMQDIGQIDRRLKNIEYYTAMTMLEASAASRSDESTIDRARNGILTDAFVGFSVADTSNEDFEAGIDRGRNELRTSTKILGGLELELQEEESVGIQRKGSLVFLPSTNVTHAEQPYANRDISVNPYNVQSFFGILQLSPKSDTWSDTKTLPDLVIQNPENENMRKFISASQDWAEPEWGSWNRTWFRDERNVSWREKTDATNVEAGRKPGHRPGGGWFTNDTVYGNRFTQGLSRTGTLSYFTPDTVYQSQGETIIDLEIIPYMRSKDIIFRVKSMRPLTLVYPYFDGKPVARYVREHNYFTMNTSSSLPYQARIGQPEFLIIKQGGTIIGNAAATMISGNRLYVDNVNISISSVNWTSNNIFIVGRRSRANLRLVTTANAYVYSSGKVNTTVAPTSTLFSLSGDAKNANFKNAVIGVSPVRIVKGTGNGQSSILSAIDTSSTPPRITVSPAFATTVDNTSIVQIGDMKTDLSGSLAGTFHMPGGRYLSGKRTLRLTEFENGQWLGASTRAGADFYSQGILRTVQERIVATIVPRLIEEAVVENKVEVTTFEARRDVGTPYRIDPVAETFLVDPADHPDGIFISSVRVCFKQKDAELPVTLQIRPTVNGYPSATEVFPFGEVTLDPTDVKISDYPNLDDPASYTEFELDGPVHLRPGEHSVVLLSNSNSYRVFYARKGAGRDLRTNVPISSQPYSGSFFKSQNGQTWTAEQESDLMFRIYRHKFPVVTLRTPSNEVLRQASISYFKIKPEYLPTSNANADIIIVSSQDIKLPNTFSGHAFVSQRAADGRYTAFAPIETNKEYFCSFGPFNVDRSAIRDTPGTRVLDPSNGSNTFIVAVGMRTRNEDVTPVIDTDRYSATFINNVINNLPISNNDIYVKNGGKYIVNSNITVSLVSPMPGTGRGAVVRANCISEEDETSPTGFSNTIDKIVVIDGGSGYTLSPRVVIRGGAPLANAEVEVNGEDKESGGNSVCRYFTKKVELAEEFASGDLRVYLNAHKPTDSTIEVYYKIHAAGDDADWEDRTWQLMTQIKNEDYISPGFDDFDELVFAPGINNVANNSVSYVSETSGEFDEFTTFAIKIVMGGDNSIDTPRIKDLRVVALPAT